MKNFILTLLLFCLMAASGIASPFEKSIAQIYESQIGVRELTGRNDGPAVEMYLKSVGLGKGYAWCAAFVHWSLTQAGIKNTVTAWSPSAQNDRNVVYMKGRYYKETRAGDVFTIYFPTLKRVGHTGFVSRQVNHSRVETVEGNTSPAGSRDGDGVYRRYRSVKSLNSISRWE